MILMIAICKGLQLGTCGRAEEKHHLLSHFYLMPDITKIKLPIFILHSLMDLCAFSILKSQKM